MKQHIRLSCQVPGLSRILFFGFVSIFFLMDSALGQSDPDSLFRFYENRGEDAYDARQYDSAIYYLQLAIQVPMKDSLIKGRVHQTLGNSFYYKGKDDLAYKAYQKALQYSLLDPEVEDLADSYYNVGFILQQRGDYTLSQDYLFKALSYYKEIYGEESIKASQAYNMIAVAYHYQREYEKALEYHQKTLKIRLDHYGEEHVRTAGSYNNLGMVYDEMERFPEAITSLQKATAIRTRLLGATHPRVGGGHTNLGVTYNSMGQHEKALKQHKKALEVYLHELDPSHPKVIASYGNIGITYRHMGNFPFLLKYTHQAIISASSDFDNPNIYQNPTSEELLINSSTLLAIRYKAYGFWKTYQQDGLVKNLHGAFQTYELGIHFLQRIRGTSYGTTIPTMVANTWQIYLSRRDSMRT